MHSQKVRGSSTKRILNFLTIKVFSNKLNNQPTKEVAEHPFEEEKYSVINRSRSNKIFTQKGKIYHAPVSNTQMNQEIGAIESLSARRRTQSERADIKFVDEDSKSDLPSESDGPPQKEVPTLKSVANSVDN